jgi:nicotinamidase-related amidase
MTSVLILIDIQNDYFENGRNELFQPKTASANAAKALSLFRELKRPLFHIQHVSMQEDATFFLPDSYGVQIHSSVAPLKEETVIIKHAPNAFFNTRLAEELHKLGITHLVICGMMSHMCIDTTVRSGKDHGFHISVLDDACTTKDLVWKENIIPASTVHNTIMASLSGVFAQVITTEELNAHLKAID